MFQRITGKKLLLGISVIILLSLVGVCLHVILSQTGEYREGADTYDELTQYISIPTPEPNEAPAGPDEPQDSRYPAVDFEALRAINPDIVAWLICENTNLNYPIVQGSDNAYYLKHLFDGRRNGSGCLFVDTGNTPGFIDHNTVIYGHNMKDKSMFSVLMNYKQQSFYDEHPQMILLTPDGDYIIELFSGYVANTKADSWSLWFSTQTEFEAWIRDTKAQSTFISDVIVSTADRFITLSTCSYEFDNARYVIVGKLSLVQ